MFNDRRTLAYVRKLRHAFESCVGISDVVVGKIFTLQLFCVSALEILLSLI